MSKPNYFQILSYAAQLAPLIELINADFADDKTAADRTASEVRAIGEVVETAAVLIGQNNPKSAADLNELAADIKTTIDNFVARKSPITSAADKPAGEPSTSTTIQPEVKH